ALALEEISELGPEDDREGLDRYEEVGPRGQPARAIGAEATAGDHVVHVRMIIQRPAPGGQDAEEAQAVRTDELRVCCQGSQRLAGGLEQRRVDHALMTASQCAQLRRQRESDQEVGARQQAIELVLEPGLSLVLLAGRAMPVTAGPA